MQSYAVGGDRMTSRVAAHTYGLALPGSISEPPSYAVTTTPQGQILGTF